MQVSLPVLLFVIFLTLKLCGVILWSWWWVTAPLWIIPALILGGMAIGFIGLLLAEIFGRK
jgi:hypothetical protein